MCTAENLQRIQAWAEDPNKMSGPLILTAPRYVNANERLVIEDGIQKKIEKESAAQSFEDCRLIEQFCSWAALPNEPDDKSEADMSPSPAQQAFCEESDLSLHISQASPTALPIENSNLTLQVLDSPRSVSSSHYSSENHSPHNMVETTGEMSPTRGNQAVVSKRGWTAIKTGVKIMSALKLVPKPTEMDEHLLRVNSWLPAPISALEITPKPWNIVRMASGSLEFISHDPHVMMLRPGSEALAEIVVAEGRSEMLGALKRVQNQDQRELERQTLAQQVQVFRNVQLMDDQRISYLFRVLAQAFYGNWLMLHMEAL